VLPRLRKASVFSLAELNEAILKLVHKLNERPFRKLAGSRAEQYRMIDRPALQPLPLESFVYAEWKTGACEPGLSHRAGGGHYYSLPYQTGWQGGQGRNARDPRWRSSIKASAGASHLRSRKPH